MEHGTPILQPKWKERMTGKELGIYFRAQAINLLPVAQRPDAIRAMINNH